MRRRLPALDGLRAVACLMVFGVHFGQITGMDGTVGPFDLGRLLRNGNSGVAIFFVLSGFLLSLPFWQKVDSISGASGYKTYLLNRCARILPAYYGCLTLLIILNRHLKGGDGVQDALSHYLLIFNYSDRFFFSINAPFWTLAVEAQFYVLLPLIFVLHRRLSPEKRVAAVVLLAAGCYVAHAWLQSAAGAVLGPRTPVSPVLSQSLLAHLPHFLFGVVAAYVHLSRAGRGANSWISDVIAWLCVSALFVVLSTPIDDLLQLPYGRYNLPFVPALIAILIVCAPTATSLRAILNAFPIRSIGLISYGIYIYHMPIQNITGRYLRSWGVPPQEHWLLFGFASLALTILVASASYLAVERPTIEWVRRITATRRDRRRELA